jgi:hypothetical protein
MDAESSELVSVGDRVGQWLEGAGVGNALVWSVDVIEGLVFVQGVQEMPLVEDQGPVE